MLLSDYRREKAAERARATEINIDELVDKLESGKTKLSEQQKEMVGNEGTLDAQKRLIDANWDEIGETQIAHEKQVKAFKKEIKEYQNKKATAVADYEDVIKKSDEATALVNKADEVYGLYAGMSSSDRQYEMFEEIVQLRISNEKKDDEIKSLKQKLNQVYDFMKQFTLNGSNMLEQFLQSIRENVQQMVAGRRR